MPARDVRALARAWGKKKIYLAAGAAGTGFGGAGRGATGAQWARCMVMMMAMQGWGKPGINFGNLQDGTPLDHDFYFPGYAEGGISGELQWNGNAVNNYQRMPHVLTLNPVKQLVPRQQLPEAIIEGKARRLSLGRHRHRRSSSRPSSTRCRATRAIHMLYRYGGSCFGTLTESDRMARGLPAREHRVRGQPVDLDGGRGAVRRRDPARLHARSSAGTSANGRTGGGYLPSWRQRQSTTA